MEKIPMTDEKLNIAMFGHKHIPSREGGVEIVVEELSTRMAALGHHVTCYNRGGHHISDPNYDINVSDVYKGVNLQKVWTIERKGFAALTSSFSAAYDSAFSDADIVHIHAEGPAAMCWLPKMRGKKVVVTIHGLDWERAKWGRYSSQYIKWGEREAVRRADEIIVLSHAAQDYFDQKYHRKTVFIPNGISKPEKEEADEITKRWGLTKDSYVLFVGRIVPEKGIQYLLEAWKDIHTDKKLVITGGSSDTNQFLESLKKTAGENVIFTGFQQGQVLAELYSNAYIFVLPSDLEGMSLSLLEAMSYGNCCLVSDIPECSEVVEDKAVKFIKGNIKSLQNSLQKLLDEQAQVKEYKNITADFVCEKYNWDDVVRQTLLLYK